MMGLFVLDCCKGDEVASAVEKASLRIADKLLLGEKVAILIDLVLRWTGEALCSSVGLQQLV